MTEATALPWAIGPLQSPFAGADVCQEAGLSLPDGVSRPMFADDQWDFTEVIGLPRQMSRVSRRFDFTPIVSTRWRLLAKEQIMAMLAPRHDAVMPLPHAYRTPLHLLTVFGRLAELTRFLNWLASQGTTSLGDVDEECCEAWLAHRRYLLDASGHVVGERSPATRRAAAQAVADLVTHRELFTTDRVPTGLRPWRGAAPSVVAEMPCGTGQNKTRPVSDSLLQPMLAAALYLTSTLGPHAPGLLEQVRDADQRWSLKHGEHVLSGRLPAREITQVLEGYRHDGASRCRWPPTGHVIRKRLEDGWSPDDPLAPVSLGLIARQAGFTQFWSQWIPPPARTDRGDAGGRRGRKAVRSATPPPSTRADGQGSQVSVDGTAAPRLEAVALTGIIRTASITLLAAVSGMRSSELMELEVGCCRPHEEHGLVRYRLARLKVIKDQPHGGTPDEWVVIEPAYQAAQLLERLHDNPQPGKPLLGRFAFDVRYQWFRDWVNGPAAQRLGLAPIPDDPVSLRALRRTLSIELAYRPGGMLAAKLHLKHIAVATTEGYASRPGGAQAELLAEVNKHEAEHNLELVWAELRNYQQGIMPAGPGARELTEFFAHIDGKLTASEHGAPKTQASDRDILNLMTKRARTLHLGTANYCWFTDPARALCLKLAGTPAADKPLIGMCDSARCPQATHHPCHHPVWAEHAENTKAFLGQLGPTRKTEKARLQADRDRALRVLDAIDAASPDTNDQEQEQHANHR